MSKNSNEIKLLRAAASEGKVNDCIDLVHSILLDIKSPQKILTFGAAQLMHHVADFEAKEKDTTWVRSKITEISTIQPDKAIPENIPELYEDYKSPGSNNFMTGIHYLWLARKAADDLPKCAELTADAIASAIVTQLLHMWYQDKPEKWEAWYRDAQVDPDTGEPLNRKRDPKSGEYPPPSEATAISLQFYTDPKTTKYQSERWTLIANQLERLLEDVSQGD